MTDHVPDIHPTAAPPAPAAGTTAPVAAAVVAAPAAAPAEPAAGEAGHPSFSSSVNADAAPADAGSGSDAGSDAGAETAADSHADAARPAGNGKRRGGRNRRKSGSADGAQEQQPPQPAAPQAEGGAKAAPRGPRPIPPALEKLAALYPQLFGAVFRPLKRGIFQDLMAAHPEDFEREALKVALGIHTRSTRYLQSVAAGQQRHDLQGQAVEAMAPEHVHQALVEVHRRRSGRNNPNSEDLLPKLRARIVANIESSGLSREAYAERVRTRDEAANALLDEALAEMAAKTAREEALVRAFEASGKTVEAFADMYGMDPRNVARSLHSAQARAAAEATAAAQQEQEEARSDTRPAAPAESSDSQAVQADAPAAAAAAAAAAAPVADVATSVPAKPAAPATPAPRSADSKTAAPPTAAVALQPRLWCLRSPMTMTPPAPRRGRWS